MRIGNPEIADAFQRLADLLEIEGANPFRVRAYREAARVVRGHGTSVAVLVERGEDLTSLPGIGKDLAAKIRELAETGRLELLDKVEARTPPALAELMRIESLGPKRVKALYDNLDIHSIEDLRQAADEGRIRELDGFGAKTEQMIRQRLDDNTDADRRIKLIDAEATAEPLIAHLKKSREVKTVTVAGSYRRLKETVGDLDILVTAGKNSTVMRRFVAYEAVAEIISQGKTRSSVRLRNGLRVDLRLVRQVSYGAALHYFTGSRAHNVAVRRRAARHGYKVNEYGVYIDDKRIAGRTEKEVYRQLGLAYIRPELREDRGEIEAARRDRLPEPVGVDDLRGDLHCHTNASDGRHSLKQMAATAARLGYEYLAVTDHSQRLRAANGLNKKRLFEQIESIDAFNSRSNDIVILKSIEVDILEDGSLALPDSVLRELDFTVCSVHHKFNLSQKQQTERIIRAMDNRYFTILGHPTGRVINERPPYAVDIETVLRAAADRNRFVEINARPKRLDLTDEACLLARRLGVKLSIASDAHSADNLDRIRYGVNQARRGWLEAGDIINTHGLAELRQLFYKTR